MITANESSAQRTRHLGAQLNLARECHKNGQVEVKHIPAKDQLADMMTKPLSNENFILNRNRLLSIILITLISIVMTSSYTLETKTHLSQLENVVWLETNHYVEIGRQKF